jgi:predicted ATPase
LGVVDGANSPTLDWIEVRDYGCVRHVKAPLTRLHALIGPNDSGKSTLLRAISDVVEALSFLSSVQWLRMSDLGTTPPVLSLDLGVGIGDWHFSTKRPKSPISGWKRAAIVRFEADALRAPSGLIPEDKKEELINRRGLGLAGVYMAILGRGDDLFQRLGERLRQFFPTVKAIRVTAVASDKLVLEVELVDGARVRADKMSEGLLYYLAYAALPYFAPSSILLIEEPETGLHPARIAEVVRMLRAMTEQPDGPQIIMATHSPLVINELRPEEVSVVTRPSVEVGTQVTRLMDTPHFAERSKVYALGELWLSYADGNFEAPLLEGKSP